MRLPRTESMERATEIERACDIDCRLEVKNREENKFSSRVEVRFVTLNDFKVVIKRWA